MARQGANFRQPGDPSMEYNSEPPMPFGVGPDMQQRFGGDMQSGPGPGQRMGMPPQGGGMPPQGGGMPPQGGMPQGGPAGQGMGPGGMQGGMAVGGNMGPPRGMRGGGMPQGMQQDGLPPGPMQQGGMQQGGLPPGGPMQQQGMPPGPMQQGGMPQGGMVPNGMPPGTRAMPVLPGQMQMGQLPPNMLGDKAQSGMQAGVQYMPCIVPIDQLNQGNLPMGAVPIGQLSASQLPNAALHISQMTANAKAPMPVPGQPMGQAGPNAGWAGQQQQQRPPASRPTRGRSPQARGRPTAPVPPQGFQQASPQKEGGFQTAPPKEERDWATVRKFLPEGESRQRAINAPSSPGPSQPQQPQQSGSLGPQAGPGVPVFDQGKKENIMGRSSSKDAWRSTGKEAWRQPERQLSAARKAASPERRSSPLRNLRPPSAERRLGSPPRTGAPTAERKGSVERRTSVERRNSVERARSADPKHARSMGSMRLECDFHAQPQPSEWWQHKLPNGSTAHVYLVADPQALSQAVSRLQWQGARSLTAVDVQGVNLRAAAGRLCLMQVAFYDGGGLQVFIFDTMQLGGDVGALMEFLQNPTAPKFMYNAQLAATVLAHKFGITLTGVFDVGVAYSTLEYGAQLNSMLDYFEWCGLSVPGAKQETQRIERNPEVWAHRPLAKGTLSFAVQNICTLHASYQMLSQRLVSFCGPQSIDAVMYNSQQLVQVHATAGWSCRNAGLWIGEQNPQKERDDPELDDWLAKRFNNNSAAARKASPERPTTLPDLPVTAVRAEDSPRTASWRAAVAALAAPAKPERQRSSSPTLESWIARRQAAKTGGTTGPPEPRGKRATSMPSRRLLDEDKDKRWDGPFDIGAKFREFINPDEDRRAWAEILEDEQAKEAEDDGDDIFEQLNNVERRRHEQAENS